MHRSAVTFDIVIVGAGHNGLVTAAYLARKGLRVLALERRPVVGGACVTEEVFPGCKVSTAAYLTGLLLPEVIRDLELPRFGYTVMAKDPPSFTPLPDGRCLFLWQDQRRSCEEIAKFSRRDAEAYPAYVARLDRLARFVEGLLAVTPPNLPPRAWQDWMGLAALGRKILRLPAQPRADLIRIMTQSVRDFLDGWFESDALKVTLATDGVIGANGGPMTPGTAYVLLHHCMGEVNGVRGVWGFVRGGMGGLTQALARSAEAHGATIRVAAPVDRILVRDGRVTGVALESGEEIPARVVASNADPKRTFLHLVGPEHLEGEFAHAVDRINMEGVSMKVNLALGELPRFRALPGTEVGPQHRATIHLCPSLEAMEQAWDDAKYGRPSARPMLEVTIPTTYDDGLAPPGIHLMSNFAQYAPYRLAGNQTWADIREAIADRVIQELCEYAPNVRGAILHRHILTPADLESEYGMTGGNIFHGAMSLDQLFCLRPVAGWARYRTPIRGLYLCGSGAHPGGGVTGPRAATRHGRFSWICVAERSGEDRRVVRAFLTRIIHECVFTLAGVPLTLSLSSPVALGRATGPQERGSKGCPGTIRHRNSRTEHQAFGTAAGGRSGISARPIDPNRV
jgi:phytoene dehydrogenase-like protein